MGFFFVMLFSYFLKPFRIVVFFVGLTGPSNRHFTFFYIFIDGATCSDEGFVGNHHWANECGTWANKNVFTDDGFVLLVTIIIGDDRSASDVGLFTNFTIP